MNRKSTNVTNADARPGTFGPAGKAGRLLSAGLLAAATALAAQAQDLPGDSSRPGPGLGGSPGRWMMMPGGLPEHMARSIDRLLDGLNTTEAQRTQIRQIATAAAVDLKGHREAERGLRERGLQIFTAPSVDAGAAESLRQQMSAQRDQTSRRVLQAMLDVAGVLTPEQRATVGRRMRDREGIMRDRMQRMQPPSAPSR